jgi:signal transduction histidine kinase
MDITVFFPLISALFVLSLGLIVFLHGGTIRMNFTFVLFTVVITIWLLGTFMMFLDKDTIDQVIFWDKFVYIGVVFIPAVMYHFGLALINDVSKSRKIVLRVGYVLSFFFLILIPTKFFVDGAFIYSWGAHSQAQPLHAIFLIYFVTYLLLWFKIVYAYYKSCSDPIELDKIRLVFIGFAVLASLGSLGFLPAYGISVYPFSYVSGVVFTAILAYTIFKFQLFSIKIVAAELLVFMIWISAFIQVVMATSLSGVLLGGMVLVSSVILGVFLIQSVDSEVEQRERVQKLAEELQTTNARQEGLLHFIGHEVKGFLAKSAGAFASLSEGDFGVLPETVKPFVLQALAESRQGVDSVTTILKASNLKKGMVTYTKESFDFKALVAEAVERSMLNAAQKGLEISFTADDDIYTFTGDKGEIGDHVLHNLIDNAINYTPSGSVIVSLKKKDGKIFFTVRDSGIGITDEDKKQLFTEGGHGKNSIKVNVHSTGYGLYIAKSIIEAHGGTIRAESAGEGKGSTFTVELPV